MPKKKFPNTGARKKAQRQKAKEDGANSQFSKSRSRIGSNG